MGGSERCSDRHHLILISKSLEPSHFNLMFLNKYTSYGIKVMLLITAFGYNAAFLKLRHSA